MNYVRVDGSSAAPDCETGTTITVDFIGVALTKTNNFRWLRRGWFSKVLQQASVTQYGDIWWNDVEEVDEP